MRKNNLNDETQADVVEEDFNEQMVSLYLNGILISGFYKKKDIFS